MAKAVQGRILVLLALLGPAALLAGCTSYDPCFTPPSIITGARILAARADPPEALFELAAPGASGGGAPADGDSIPPVNLRALVVGQVLGVFLQAQARLCAPTDDHRCPDDAAATPEVITLINDSEVTVTIAAPGALLREALAADPLQGYGGIRLQADLEVRAGADLLRVSKLLIYSPRRPGYQPNHALELGTVSVSEQDAGTIEEPPFSILNLSVGHTYGLRPHALPGEGASEAAEEYQVTDLSGRTLLLREQITWSFFSGPDMVFGDLRAVGNNLVGVYTPDADVADEPPPGEEPPDGLVRMTALKQGFGALWAVARDGRGAEAWTRLKLATVDERVCFRGEGAGCAAGAACCPALSFGCQ